MAAAIKIEAGDTIGIPGVGAFYIIANNDEVDGCACCGASIYFGGLGTYASRYNGYICMNCLMQME